MTKRQKYCEILKTLQRTYPGKIVLSVEEFARASGMAKGTVYNRVHDKSKYKLDIPIVKIGKRPCFRIHDVARYFTDL